jgi:hypothetical protein
MGYCASVRPYQPNVEDSRSVEFEERLGKVRLPHSRLGNARWEVQPQADWEMGLGWLYPGFVGEKHLGVIRCNDPEDMEDS